MGRAEYELKNLRITQMSDTPANSNASEGNAHSLNKLQTQASWIVVVILIAFGAYALFMLTQVHNTPGDYWQTLIRQQFPVLVGLPMAGLGALFLVLILRISAGPLEFEIAGVKLKGAAAPVTFWILCFLSGAIAIKLLWQTAC